MTCGYFEFQDHNGDDNSDNGIGICLETTFVHDTREYDK